MEDGTTSKAVLLQCVVLAFPCECRESPRLTQLLRFDFGWTVATGESLFPNERQAFDAEFPQSPFPPDIEALISRLPEGFQTLARHNSFSTATLMSLGRATEAYRWSGSRVYSSQLAERRRWRRKYNDFCESCPSINQPGTHGGVLDKLVSLALLTTVCTSFTPARMETSTFSGARAELLRGLMSPSFLAGSDMEQQCMIWIHVAAVDAWKTTGNRLLPEGVPLVQEFRLRFPEIRSAVALDAIVRRFFWNLSFLKTATLICPDDTQES